MVGNIRRVRSLVAIVVGGSLLACASTVSAARPLHVASSIRTQQPPSTLVLTKDGVPVNKSISPCPVSGGSCANDLHFVWKPGGNCYKGLLVPAVIVLFTVGGRPASEVAAPCKADDFEFYWNEAGQVKLAEWTEDGAVIKHFTPKSIPSAYVNDVHVFWLKGRSLGAAYWTDNGKKVASIRVPEGTNDAHWILSSTTTPVASRASVRPAQSSLPSYLNFTHNGTVNGSTKSPCLTVASGAVECANDLHFRWKITGKCYKGIEYPPMVVVWTINGAAVGSNPNEPYPGLNLAPCRANDFEWSWNDSGSVIVGYWTYNGKRFAKIEPPPGVNDVDAYWFKNILTTAWWTLDGKTLKPVIQVPKGTNDAHWMVAPQ